MYDEYNIISKHLFNVFYTDELLIKLRKALAHEVDDYLDARIKFLRHQVCIYEPTQKSFYVPPYKLYNNYYYSEPTREDKNFTGNKK